MLRVRELIFTPMMAAFDVMKTPATCTDCPYNENDICLQNPMSPGNLVNNEPEHFLCPLEFRKPKRKKKVRTDLPIEETLFNHDWMYAQYITNEMETAKIAEIVNRTGSNVIRWLHIHKIEVRNRTENMRLYTARKRRKWRKL